MVYVGSVGLGIPENQINQTDIKQLVQHIFNSSNRKLEKLLPVFDNAKVTNRQFVSNKDWYKQDHTFAHTNNLYVHHAIRLSLASIDECLTNGDFLTSPIPYDAIDMIIFVSSTGIVTPSLDAFIINKRPFRENINRMPLWGLGCAGGAIGLSRASEWIRLHQQQVALVVCCELCSLTFQKKDLSTSNIVGTAIFGDGVATTLLVGQKSPYKERLKENKLTIKKSSSFIKKNTTSIMGWNMTNNGFEVIFSKNIPKLIKTLWKDHVERFLQNEKIRIDDISTFIAHPGGRKVLEEMEAALKIEKNLFIHSYEVLNNHGNMSSATVLYVLKQWFQTGHKKNYMKEKAILSALGPGFCSELLLLEWCN